jgi:hypothetical protein
MRLQSALANYALAGQLKFHKVMRIAYLTNISTPAVNLDTAAADSGEVNSIQRSIQQFATYLFCRRSQGLHTHRCKGRRDPVGKFVQAPDFGPAVAKQLLHGDARCDLFIVITYRYIGHCFKPEIIRYRP